MQPSSFFAVAVAMMASMVAATPTPAGSDPNPPCPTGYTCWAPRSDGGCDSCKSNGRGP
ncbi:hypothetical protein C8034_v006293 [Colletotrichum sidae]|uniref:Uncharacterized protein n=2 Tax=Colletotrichum orbiculare species complex TaxID=2707354 RepID=A0A4R8PS55_9PEZI|nr:hypothetical protein C8035_v007510 [Colletotrichum spinosum]TEA22096.1 hypothetical protein C8034_v006293 [Colletotrichum sidae]